MKEDKSLRILVVDDHEMFREQACALLRSQPGFEVICEAANGLEGVSRAAELQPDVVVLDISMPSLGGIEAAGRIHRFAPKSQIVFLSQHNSETIAQTALAAGALAYVTKSSASTDLIRAVRGQKVCQQAYSLGSERQVETSWSACGKLFMAKKKNYKTTTIARAKASASKYRSDRKNLLANLSPEKRDAGKRSL